MAITAYSFHPAVAEADLQSTFDTEIAAGRWLVGGSEGLHFVKDKGFKAVNTGNTAASGTRFFSLLFWANSARTPTNAVVYTSVAADDMQDTVDVEGTAGRDLVAVWVEFDKSGKARYDLVFTLFA